jgi:hypothetical protein
VELAWREFQIRVKIWPLQEDDYYYDDEEVLIIEPQRRNGYFIIVQPYIELKLQSMKPLFMLRRSQDGENLPVNVLERVGEHCHVLNFVPKFTEGCLYQLYTADEKKTYYSIPKGHVLQVFWADKRGKLTMLGWTRNNDTYVCFALNENVVAIVACVARTEEEVEQYIAEETKFSL